MNPIEKINFYEKEFAQSYDEGTFAKSGMNVLRDINKRRPAFVINALDLANRMSANSKLAIKMVAQSHALLLKDETSYDGKHVKYSPYGKTILFGKQRDYLKRDLAYLKGKEQYHDFKRKLLTENHNKPLHQTVNRPDLNEID